MSIHGKASPARLRPWAGLSLGMVFALAASEAAAEDAIAAYVPKVDPVTTYLDAIDRTEAEFNAYSLELTDLYLGLGEAFLQKGDFEKAKEAYQQGVQIVRVNFGLNSPDQTNYLFAVADIESRTGNWREADRVLSEILSINERNFGENDPGMIPVLEQMYNWYQNHRTADGEVSSYVDLERSTLLAGKMAEITELDRGLGHPDTTASYRRIGRLHWQTVKYLLERGISVEPGVIISVGSPAQNPNTRSISIKSHVAAGRDALVKAAESVAMNENRTPVEYAEALAQVGDWNLAFGKKQTAGESYEQAWHVIRESVASDEQADEYFASPTPVRFLTEELFPVDGEPGDESVVYLDISMDVSEGGRPLDVNIENAPDDVPGDELRRLKRTVSDMRFRPRVIKGVVYDTDDFVWQVPLVETGWVP